MFPKIFKKVITEKKNDFLLWFLFFFIIYIILILKTLTIPKKYDSLFFTFYSVIIAAYILSRFLLSYFHKSISYDEKYQPTIAFVVPAKNEEDNIRETIRRFSQVNYPKDKIEIIVINDGSTDNTLSEMEKAKKEIDKSIKMTIVDWKINKGKRHGMAEGVKMASNEIVIFIDSDSFIEKEAVHHLVKYFANKEVGAVSGHTDVYNGDKNILTRMQALRYYIAFRVYKSAESIFGNVTCCPGCCSAYRRSYLLGFLDEWLNQTFFGSKCTFGDDRNLTNFTIRKYKAVYSSQAKAFTVVPDSYKKYFRQQQRWKKSWVRETLIASSFMWKKNPLASVSFYIYIFLALVSPIVFFRAMLYIPIISHELPVPYMIGLLLMLLLHGLFYRIETGKKKWILPVISFWFYTVILMWQLPWAIITMKDSRWGTR